MEKKLKFLVSGIHCKSCEKKIKDRLTPTCESVQVNISEGAVALKFDPSFTSAKKIKGEIEKLGFQIIKMNLG